MGIDYYTCYKCGNTFADCGDYVDCNNEDCNLHWCCDECANGDNATEGECKNGYNVYDNRPEDSDECDEGYCDGCEDYIRGGCDYCRGENYDDYELLSFALLELGLSRTQLIDNYNKSKEETEE